MSYEAGKTELEVLAAQMKVLTKILQRKKELFSEEECVAIDGVAETLDDYFDTKLTDYGFYGILEKEWDEELSELEQE